MGEVLGTRQLWAFALGKMLTDPVWWFYLFWLPKFLASEHGIRGVALIPYLTTVYLIADAGSIFGGYLSSTLIKRGWSVNCARKTAMGDLRGDHPDRHLREPDRQRVDGGAADRPGDGVPPGLVGESSSRWRPTCSRGGRSARWSGFGGFMGGVGGILIAEFAGRVLNRDPSYYLPMFIVGGTLYIVALAVVHALAPRLEPAQLRGGA